MTPGSCAGAGSTPGGAAYTRSAGRLSISRPRLHSLVVTTAAAALSAARSAASPSGMCIEHHHPQPGRRGREHVRHGGRDQPVDQHEPAGRQRGEHPGQPGAVGVRRARPGARHGVLADRPAGGGQPVADPAVVRVAAAGRRRVVDVVGQDDV